LIKIVIVADGRQATLIRPDQPLGDEVFEAFLKREVLRLPYGQPYTGLFLEVWTHESICFYNLPADYKEACCLSLLSFDRSRLFAILTSILTEAPQKKADLTIR